MEVIRVTPCGYRYGEVCAIAMARKAARDPLLPRPISIVGQIVHNSFAVEEITKLGLITLDGPNRAMMVKQIESGTIIFAAHGVLPEARRMASERGLHLIDATCPEVAKTHESVLSLVKRGYQIISISKKGDIQNQRASWEKPQKR